MAEITKILVPIDFSAGSRTAVEYATMFARRTGATIDLLHAWQFPILPGDSMTGVSFSAEIADQIERDAAKALEEWKVALCADVPGSRAFLAMGDPSSAVIERAKQGYDLIIAGTHGRTGISRWALGSVAERIVRHAPCPVLTVRAPRHLSVASATL